jgi:hypothetical protein
MTFADLKNDFVFRRIFATHPAILRRLLNDLLERTDAQTIEEIEYLPGEQLPVAEGAKLSILDVRCKDRAGTTFVVEMQLIHHLGFVNRVVYNACKAYVGQLKEGDWYTKLTDVVAISICDFELWPDATQEKKGLPRVPMLSRWNMTERSSSNHGLLQVQYAFLELPKMPDLRPDKPGAELWAWLFVHATELTEVRPTSRRGPNADALELRRTRRSSRRRSSRDVQKVRDERSGRCSKIAEARFAEGESKGKAEGTAEGKNRGKAEGTAEGKIEANAKRSSDHPRRARIARDGHGTGIASKRAWDAETLDRWTLTNVFEAKTAAEVPHLTPTQTAQWPEERGAGLAGLRRRACPACASLRGPVGLGHDVRRPENDFVFRRIFATHPAILRRSAQRPARAHGRPDDRGDRIPAGASSSPWRRGRSSRSWMSAARTARARRSWSRCSSSTTQASSTASFITRARRTSASSKRATGTRS